MAKFREGFYAFYYTGKAGSGVILMCLANGRLVGADQIGGQITGVYQVKKGVVKADVSFRFAPGSLVTGQVLLEPTTVSVPLSLPIAIFMGEVAKVDIGMGPVNARAVFVSDPL